MIIRSTEDHLLLIAQSDHAAVAETIVGAWQRDGFPVAPRRRTVLLATRRHDDGWIDEDRSPLVDEASGRLVDFANAPDAVKQRIWPRALALLTDTPYAGALVAEHARHLFEAHREDRLWRSFFAGLDAARSERLAAAGLEAADLQSDYFFVRIGDLLSLTFCNGWSEPQRDGEYRARWDGARLAIAPDPFGGVEVPLTVAARRLPNRPFSSRSEAAAAYAAAPTVALQGVATGS